MAPRRSRALRRLAGTLLPRSPLRRAAVLAAATALVALASLNLAVSFFGQTLVNPLSPTCLRAKASALARYFAHRPRCLVTGGHDDLGPVIAGAARRHHLDRALLEALIDVESGARPHRISGSGAMGPAQLVGSTADMLGVRDPFDPVQGIDGGARYLKDQLVHFQGNVPLAVAAYNAGPGAVVDGRVPRNGETEFYVARVLARWHELRPPPPRARPAVSAVRSAPPAKVR